MARYRRFDPRFWKDEKVRTLTLTEKSIAIYGFTAQSNRIGIFSFSPGEACEDLELKPETFAKGFKNVCQTLGWQWEERSRVLYLPTWWKYNPPENANNVIGNLKDLSDVPHSPLVSLFSNNLQYLPGTLHQTFTQTFLERYPKRSPSQEQYQEQYQEKEPPISPKGGSVQNIPPIKKKRPPQAKHPLPENFAVSPEVTLWAAEKKFTRLNEHLEWFVGYALANGKTYADWDHAFKNAIRGNWAKLGDESPDEFAHFPRIDFECHICGCRVGSDETCQMAWHGMNREQHEAWMQADWESKQ